MKIIFPVMGAESISVCYLSTALKNAGHTVQVAFDRALFDDKQYFSIDFLHRLFDKKQNMVDEIIKAKPDILAFSVFTDNYQWTLDVIKRVWEHHKCITVVGGMHPTSCPNEVISAKEINYMIIGEGEAPLVELLDCISKGSSLENVPNLWMKKDSGIIKNPPRPLLNGEDFPMVDKTIYEKFIPFKEYYLTVSSKGCISRCSYCTQNFLHSWEKENQIGKFLREKPVDMLIEELKIMKARYGIEYVDIKNNVLSGSQKWIQEFASKYPKEIGLPFRIMGHPLLYQKTNAQLMKSAGCHHIQLGIESFNPDVRGKVLLRKESNEQIILAMDNIEKAGINFSADLIIGLPGESENDLKFALKTLAGYNRLIRASIFWLQYLPGVEITKMAMDKGFIDQKNLDMINRGLQKNYLSTGSPMESDRMKILKTYHIWFRLLPITPKWLIDFLVNTDIFRILRFLPFQTVFIIAIDIFVSFVKKDYYAKWIMKWYVKQITKQIFGRIHYISNED
jgi:radical SAM superfamily enzyme YgiQ (UPF0313 family)